jgi:uncharacterized protein YndB with AHSA1/START domain
VNPRVDIRCQIDVACDPERIFDLIVDFRGQDRWLSKSSAYRGTRDVSPGEVRVGTTYSEPGPLGVRRGTVTELERPLTVVFHQPMTLRLRFGTVDIVLRYTVSRANGSTRVTRLVNLHVPPLLRPFNPVVARLFRHENERTLRALKAHADALGRAG